MSVEEIGGVGRRFADEVINKQNLAAADELVAEDFVELDPLHGQEQGREGLKQILAMFFAAFSDLRWTSKKMLPKETSFGVVLLGVAPTEVSSWVFLPLATKWTSME